MTTSPELHHIVEAIRARRRFVISSHSRPDGDSIGSQLAAAYALRALGKQVTVVNADPAPPPLLQFPGVSDITIAGCMVTEGRITRAGDTQARLLRDHVVIYEGKIGSLRRFKDDASEVKAGFECGIGFEKFNDLKVGDVIEVFAMERVAVTA